jgi:hypothetical protein
MQRIGCFDATKSYERRVVVKDGPVKIVTLSAFGGAQILQFWIPDSIVPVKGHCQGMLKFLDQTVFHVANQFHQLHLNQSHT